MPTTYIYLWHPAKTLYGCVKVHFGGSRSKDQHIIWQHRRKIPYLCRPILLYRQLYLSLDFEKRRSLETRMTSHISFWDFVLISSTPHHSSSSVKLKCHLWAAYFAQKLPRIGVEWDPEPKITQLYVVEGTYIFIVLKVEIGHFVGLLIVHLPTFPTKSTNNSLFYQTF